MPRLTDGSLRIVHNPAYQAPYHSDVSLILLDRPVTGITPARIAALGFLDELRDVSVRGAS